MPSNRQDIFDDIVTTLRAISTPTYQIAPRVVSVAKQIPSQASLLPWLGVRRGRVVSEHLPGRTIFKRFEIEIFGIVTSINRDGTDQDVSEMLAAIKVALETDISRGGYAHYTGLVEEEEYESSDETFGQFKATYECRWLESALSET